MNRPNPNRRQTAKLPEDVLHAVRGLLMGGADIVPGVSGGTVALILRIYERLVTAISRFDLGLVNHLRRGQWRQAAEHVDLRFLAALGIGILLGVGGLAKLMNYLLINHAVPTWSLFFGLVLASAVLVARMIERWSLSTAALAIAGIAFAYWLVGRLPAQGPATYSYLFLCGMVAICAMILPGISGAFILLILGKYEHVIGAIGDFVHGMLLVLQGRFSEAGDLITAPVLATLFVFAIGCALGLLGFSKLLRWLLARHEPQTMAVLCGFMFGSLRKIWPFKQDMTPEVADIKRKQFENIWPGELSGEVALSLALVATGVVLVFFIDWLTRGHEHVPPLKAQEPADAGDRGRP